MHLKLVGFFVEDKLGGENRLENFDLFFVAVGCCKEDSSTERQQQKYNKSGS